MSGAQVRDVLDANPIIGEPRARRFWTGREVKLLRQHYPAGGIPACLPVLPGRSASAIYNRVGQLGLRAPSESKRGVPRQRWTTTDFIDAAIRRAYQGSPSKGDVLRLAQTLNRPKWWVSKRAARLGVALPRFKELPWVEAELAFISENAHRDPVSLSRSLHRRGYARTATAISVKLKRLGADCSDPDHYTARGLAGLMGVDDKAVARWIEKGWLVASRRGTDRVAEQGGDQWWIHHRSVRRFIIDNAAAVDIRKIDKFWLIALLAGESSREEAA